MNKNPLISVIMPAYNAENFISEAIDSILNQTLSDFELVVINDGSTDKTLQIIENYAKKDDRIVIISRENKGLIASRNEGIEMAKGKYIAKMDADDISFPERFEIQISFMKNNNVDICGSRIILFSNDKIIREQSVPITDVDIKFTLMFMSALAHPTVMMDRKIFDNLKYQQYRYAEDYKLWTDIALYGYKMRNLDMPLLKYRIHQEQVSNIYRQEQYNLACQISKKYRESVYKKGVISFKVDYKNKSYSEMKRVLMLLKADSIRNGVSDEVTLRLSQYILQHNAHISLMLFVAYFVEMRKYMRFNMLEFKIFAQSLLGITRESKLYVILNSVDAVLHNSLFCKRYDKFRI